MWPVETRRHLRGYPGRAVRAAGVRLIMASGLFLIGFAAILIVLTADGNDAECTTGDCISGWFILAPLAAGAVLAFALGIRFLRTARSSRSSSR